jgi:hypothetical protein
VPPLGCGNGGLDWAVVPQRYVIVDSKEYAYRDSVIADRIAVRVQTFPDKVLLLNLVQSVGGNAPGLF